MVLPEGLQALAVSKGELDFTPVFEETIYFWSVKTPLSSLMLPVRSFEGIDLKRIESVELIFYQARKGSILIENICVQ